MGFKGALLSNKIPFQLAILVIRVPRYTESITKPIKNETI